MDIEQIIQKTKICCLDVNQEVIDYLKLEHEVFDGSLGRKVAIPQPSHGRTLVLPNFKFPNNIQEYDVFVIDLKNENCIPYVKEKHERTYCESKDPRYIGVDYPMTIYDPIPHGAFLLQTLLEKKVDKTPIYIVFQAEKTIKKYIQCDCSGNKRDDFTCDNYDFFSYIPDGQNMFGHDVIAARNVAELLFDKHLNDITYYRTFDLPEKGYIPILNNRNGECVSFIQPLADDGVLVMLPDVKDKRTLIERLFNRILYPRLSQYFPLVEANSWIHNTSYMLPGEKELIERKETLHKYYEEQKELINEEIRRVQQNNAYLHTLITGTGDELVKAVICFLKWLGFDNVKDMDAEKASGNKEEDIQIDLGERGLLVIEVKGIFGTSTDEECSQIQKIIGRRATKHGRTDFREVYGIYIVNNERHIEPLKRHNPPFQPHQIIDAKNDERGLLTTWQLFELYHSIEEGLLTKNEARGCFLQYGWIDFKPSDLVELGIPSRYYQDDTIAEIELSNEVSVGTQVYYKHDNTWHQRVVESIQVNNVDVLSANGGASLKVNSKLPRKVMLFIKQKTFL